MIVSFSAGKYGRFVDESFDPNELKALVDELDYAFVASYEAIPKLAGWEVIQKQSAVVPIVGDAEEQLKLYHSTCRNEVRRSYREEKLSVEINPSNTQELFEFHKKCEEQRGWIPVPPEELSASLIIVVRYGEELIAGMSAYWGEQVLRVGRIFSLRRSEKYQDVQAVIFSAASRRVVHELTQWAAKHNIKWLDLGGVDPEDEKKKGITKFKMSFGSEVRSTHLGRYRGTGFQSLENYFETNKLDLT